MFGVFDGHGGKMVSNMSAKTVLECFQAHPRVVKSRGGPGGGKKHSLGDRRHKTPMEIDDVKKALYDSFLEADRRMRPAVEAADDFSGSTAVVAVVSPTFVVVANCGDSRAVMGIGGSTTVPLSWDHKPTQFQESARIVAAGGCVSNGRVDGDLAVSRSLGDYQFKRNSERKETRQRVSPEPDLTVYHRRADTDGQFLVLACDGVWDIMTNERCTGFLWNQMQQARVRSSKVSEDLCVSVPLWYAQPHVFNSGPRRTNREIARLLPGSRKSGQHDRCGCAPCETLWDWIAKIEAKSVVCGVRACT